VASRRQHRPDPGPVETDDVVIMRSGPPPGPTGLLVLLGLRLTGTTEVRDWWLGMCGYGIALGAVRHALRPPRHLAIARDAALGIPPRS
jgi:hypothetical protein